MNAVRQRTDRSWGPVLSVIRSKAGTCGASTCTVLGARAVAGGVAQRAVSLAVWCDGAGAGGIVPVRPPRVRVHNLCDAVRGKYVALSGGWGWWE